MLEAILVITIDIAFASLSLCVIAAVIYACNFILKKLTRVSIADIVKYALQTVENGLNWLGIGRRNKKP